jgi:hypothetical protein
LPCRDFFSACGGGFTQRRQGAKALFIAYEFSNSSQLMFERNFYLLTTPE